MDRSRTSSVIQLWIDLRNIHSIFWCYLQFAIAEKVKKGLPQHKAQELRNHVCSLSIKIKSCLLIIICATWKSNIFFPSHICSRLPSFTSFQPKFATRKGKVGAKPSTEVSAGGSWKKTNQVGAEAWGCCPKGAGGAREVAGALPASGEDVETSPCQGRRCPICPAVGKPLASPGGQQRNLCECQTPAQQSSCDGGKPTRTNNRAAWA